RAVLPQCAQPRWSGCRCVHGSHDVPLRAWDRVGPLARSGVAVRMGSHVYKRRPAPSSSSPPIVDAASVRAKSARLGGGAYLGLGPGGRWVTADPEHAVMVLG